MRFLNLVGNSFGCSASGERLVSAARDGDLQEAKALLDYNPRLARYSTFGVRNSPLHYSAAQGHHEIVTLLLESGVDINLRNYRGQTALMQACQYGHWEVVQILILFRANIQRADGINGGTALHFAALNGHSRCIRLLLADHIPSNPHFWNLLNENSKKEASSSEFDVRCRELLEIVNKPADGGITALHMAALNGHVDTVQFLLDLGASVTEVTIEDGSTMDLVGAGCTPLHYAACGGNAQCCQILIARGASLTAETANGWTPLMVARSWHRDWLEEVLSSNLSNHPQLLPSPYICLPLMSIIKIARECGFRNLDRGSECLDPCVVCLERKCTVAAEGCDHEFCTRCALYLCSTTTTSTATSHGPPGSIPCPLCRYGIVNFQKLPDTEPLTRENPRASLSLAFCACSTEETETTLLQSPYCKPDFHCTRISPMGSFRSLSMQKLPAGLCLGAPEVRPSLVRRERDLERDSESNHFSRCSRLSFRRSTSSSGSESKRSWFCSFDVS